MQAITVPAGEISHTELRGSDQQAGLGDEEPGAVQVQQLLEEAIARDLGGGER